ncbi:MAG: ABC transporter permease [Anaerolineaceae bacterium]|nr:ABC transporter permease [Anaerolineaceae bacterium]
MAHTSSGVVQQHFVKVSATRQRVMGVVFLIISISLFFLFALNITPEKITTFVMTPGGVSEGFMGDWVIPSQITLYLLAALGFLLGVLQTIRGFGKATNWVLGIVAAFFVFGFLTWSAAGGSLNLAGMLSNAVSRAVPLTLGALSGILCERSGVTNIAIEGMMLMGAFTGAVVGSLTHNAWFGLLAAILIGLIMGGFLAVLSIQYKVNQIISGTVINIFAAGFTTYMAQKFLNQYQNLNNPPLFLNVPIPGLAKIPLVGPIFFNANPFLYAMFVFLIVIQIALFSTRWGLRLRAVGEHPKAADTLGISVFKTRYMAVQLGGMMAGFAGAYFTLGGVGRFNESMTAGRGFIALAAMIFGNWMPFGALGAGLLFGFADSVATKLSILGSSIPPDFMGMLPYLTTMVVLAGVVGKSRAPAADGVPYEKE